MTIITPTWVFLRMTKTGSSSVQELIHELCKIDLKYEWEAIWIGGPTKERFSRLSEDEKSRFIFCSIRNPWGWYRSFWAWYSHPRMQVHGDKTSPTYDHRIISSELSFPDWLRENPGKMVDEFRLHYPENPRAIRVENLAEELVQILRELGEPLSDKSIEFIQQYPAQNVDPIRKEPYGSFYTDELKELVLQGAAPIFDTYYPDRNFPEEPVHKNYQLDLLRK